jgi:hypothetical protein
LNIEAGASLVIDMRLDLASIEQQVQVVAASGYARSAAELPASATLSHGSKLWPHRKDRWTRF